MLRNASSSSHSSFSEKTNSPTRRRHVLTEEPFPLSSRRRSIGAMFGVRNRYRIAYTILTACVIYLFMVALEQRTGDDGVPPFESFAGEGGWKWNPGTPMAAKAREAAKQAAEAAQAAFGGKGERIQRVPLPAEVERSAGHKIKDGFLRVDPDSKIHPIHQLICDARRRWDTKLSKQSETLREAVDEYQNRYQQHPPKGFDKWWRYVVENKVQLVDEYDQINRDLYPFRAVAPKDVRTLIERASKEADTFELIVKDGEVSHVGGDSGPAIHQKRLDGQLELLADVAKYIPDMRAVYSAQDTPDTIISYDLRQELEQHIENNEYMPLAKIKSDNTYTGWLASCSYMSPLRKHGYERIPVPEVDWREKSFIVDHAKSMDMCAHPDLIPQHGLLAGLRVQRGTNPLSAKFAISKTLAHADVLGVPTERFTPAASVEVVPWAEKTGSKLLWRGANTGIWHKARNHWRGTHRLRLMSLTNAVDGVISLLAPVVKGSVGQSLSDAPLAALNGEHMDLAFVGEPIQCSQADGSCAEVKAGYAFRGRVTPADFDAAKYLIDVDGNAWSARFQRLMLSGSLLLKSTVMPEWFNDRIMPWVHYVPIKLDYGDLYDALVFFKHHDALAEEVGRNARAWTERFYRKEDMTAYAFRLYLEWSRLQAPDRAGASFAYDESMEMRRE